MPRSSGPCQRPLQDVRGAASRPIPNASRASHPAAGVRLGLPLPRPCPQTCTAAHLPGTATHTGRDKHHPPTHAALSPACAARPCRRSTASSPPSPSTTAPSASSGTPRCGATPTTSRCDAPACLDAPCACACAGCFIVFVRWWWLPRRLRRLSVHLLCTGAMLPMLPASRSRGGRGMQAAVCSGSRGSRPAGSAVEPPETQALSTSPRPGTCCSTAGTCSSPSGRPSTPTRAAWRSSRRVGGGCWALEVC